MSAFPGSPRLLKGGLVLLDPDSFAVLPNGVIVMQYNPDTLTRTLKIKDAEEDGDQPRLVAPTLDPAPPNTLEAIPSAYRASLNSRSDTGKPSRSSNSTGNWR